ncbi:MAG: ABC transporter permease [Chloroflexi bacterium]|nr:ABC transporter permease [Chloroflexota bacterium]
MGVATSPWIQKQIADDKMRFRFLRDLRNLLAELSRDRVALFGLLITLGVTFMAVFANVIAPHDPTEINITQRLMPGVWDPAGSTNYLLGTDQLGRDILSRIIYGSRVSIAIGVGVVLIAGTFGIFIGLISGYYGGRVDEILMRITDIQTAFPGLLLALTIITIIGPSVRNLIIVLSINGWMVYARITRGIMLSMRELPYMDAARVIGCRTRRIIFLHALPNLMSPLLTLGTLELARIILAEATLSFLGLGIQPPDASWGLMIADGHDYITQAWWLVTLPGLAIALTVFGVNLVASWLRVYSDPTQRMRQVRTTD